jgi:Divergent InlB B-repeat domain
MELTVAVTGTGTVVSAPVGIGCPSRCKGTFAAGTNVTLTANPGAGQRLQSWGGRCRSSRTRCSIRMQGASAGTVRVTFVAADGTTPPPPPPGPPPPPPPPPPPASGNSVVLNGSRWTCDGPVNLDLVRVTSPPGDAIVLADGCTGRIGRIEVETWTADGVKIQNQSNPAHDLTIGGGYVRCHAIEGDTHQDAVQAMAGSRITFVGVLFDCLGNSNFFVNRAAGSQTPSDIICDGCTFGGKSSTTVRVNVSVRSGVRNSAACAGRNVREPFYFTDAAQSPVNSNNRELPSSDPLC